MPIIPQPEITKVYLPSTDKPDIFEDNRLFIVYKKSLSINDLLNYDASASEMQNAMQLLSSIIVDWNVTNEAGEALPINPTNIGQLPSEDLKVLVSIVEEVTPSDLGIKTEEKKT